MEGMPMHPFQMIPGDASIAEDPIREKSPSRVIAYAIFCCECSKIRGTGNISG